MFLIASVLCCGSAAVSAQERGRNSSSSESVYERVMRTGEIRCGYAVYSPGFMQDPNTGEFSGTSHDIIAEAASILGLKLTYAEEVSFATAVEGLRQDRYDLVCSAFYERPNVMKEVEFSTPIYFVSVNAYVRADDTRFDNGLDMLNDPAYTVASIDSTISDIVARESFPLAARASLPELSPYSDGMLTVATGKADIVFVENAVANNYLEANPGTLKRAGKPVRVFPATYHMKKGEMAFKTMLDSAINYLLNHGVAEEIISTYEERPGDYLRTAPTYLPDR